MQPVESFKNLGLAAVLVTYVTLSFLLLHWKGDRSLTISRNAHANRQTYFMMVAIESVVLPMFFLFVRNWFSPTFRMPQLFTVLVGISCFALLAAAWFPSVSGWTRRVHDFFAYGAFFLFFLTLVYLVGSHTISPVAIKVSYVAMLYLIAAPFAITFFAKAKANLFLVEWGCMLAIHSAILTAVYIR